MPAPAAPDPGLSTVDPRVRVMEMLHGSLVTQMVATVAELGIADLVADGPRDVADLAAHAGADPDALHRVLRALASVGMFREVSPRVYGSTPLADVLREDIEGSARHWARLWALPQRHAAIGALTHSVRTGRPAFEHLYDTDWWSHLSGRPDQAALFRDAMGDLARQLHAATVASYDLSGVRRLVDVGGGKGQLVTTVLHRYPGLTAVLFDQPSVVAHAPPELAAAGVADRVQIEAGNFFESVPAGGDAYLLSMILHDWTDDQAVTILRNIRRAMAPDGRVLVVEAVVPEDDRPHDGKLRDNIMLALHPGRERTESEFAALLRRAGLRHQETRAVSASTGLVVAVPG